MRNFTIINIVLVLLCLSENLCAQIVIGTPSLGFSQACASPSFNTYNVTFSFSPESGLSSTNQFIIELSDASGSFANPATLYTSNAGTVTVSPATLIFSIPNQDAYKTNMPTEFVDIYPTLCELAGLELPTHLSGESLVELINGNEVRGDQYAISQYMRGDKMGYTIRDKRYRYVEWIEEGPHKNANTDMTRIASRQFFDYEKDPLETVNYGDSEEYHEVQEKLALQLHAFYEEISN